MNLFSISGLSVGISCVILSFLALFFGKYTLHRLLFLFNFVVAIWGVGLVLVGMADSPEKTLLGWKIAHLGGFLVGPSFYHLIHNFCGIERRRLLYFGYIQGIIFIIITFSTELLFTQTRYVFDMFFPEMNPLYFLGLSLYLFFVIKSFSELLKFLGKTKGYKRTQTLYMIYGFMFGFVGATTAFMPMFHVDILYPAGNFGITIYVFIITYAILRHRIMDIHFVLRKTMTYSMSVGLITGIFIILVLFMTNFLKDFIEINSLLLTIVAALLIALLFNPIKSTLQSVVDKVFYKTTYDYYRTIQNISQELSVTVDLKKVYTLIAETLFETLKLESISLLSHKDEYFKPVYIKSAKGQISALAADNGITFVKREAKKETVFSAKIKIDNDSDLVLLLRSRDIVVMDELTSMKGHEFAESIENNLSPYKVSAIAPIFIEDELEYIMILGEKLSGDMFSIEDINLISTTAKQSAIALKNAKLYDELEQRVTARTAELSAANERLSTEIFERIKAEDALNAAHKELEQRIEERTSDLIASNQLLQLEITERKKLEEQLLHAEKMKAVGTLTGGIAHEFNNILSTIIGYGEMLQDRIHDKDPLKRYVDIICTSAKRASDLIGNLLTFSRKQIIHPKPIRINHILKQSDILLSKLIGEDISIITLLSDKDPIVHIDPGQLEQILLNLATNARDAMPDGGSLIIESRLSEIDDEIIKERSYLEPGMYAVISVTDSGTGMNEETKARVFEPFYTTKEVGKGTGLGLSTVYGIVKQNNGYINVYSEPGIGTTFKIYLPLIQTDLEEPVPVLKEAPAVQGSETILVAEDDNDVREYIIDILESSGFKTIEAKTGEDAIEKFGKNRDRINLLLLDVVMPKKNGKEVYDEARTIKPGVKALFLSGYSENLIHVRGILQKGIEFLPKPVSKNTLLAKIREILDKQP